MKQDSNQSRAFFGSVNVAQGAFLFLDSFEHDAPAPLDEQAPFSFFKAVINQCFSYQYQIYLIKSTTFLNILNNFAFSSSVDSRLAALLNANTRL